MKKIILGLIVVTLFGCEKVVPGTYMFPKSKNQDVVTIPKLLTNEIIKKEYSVTGYYNINYNNDWSKLTGAESYQWADVNADGIVDKIIIYSNQLWFALGSKTGTYQFVSCSVFLTDYTPNTKDTLFGVPGGERFNVVDINKDSLPDFIFNQTREIVDNGNDLSDNYVFIVYSTPVIGKYMHKIISMQSGSISVGDFNNDNISDIINVSQKSGDFGNVYFYQLDKNINYTKSIINFAPNKLSMVNLNAQSFSEAIDFDNNGKLDMITYGINYGDSANNSERQRFGPTIWFDVNNSGYSKYTLLHDADFYKKYMGWGKFNETTSLFIYDIDNDGLKDIIMNNRNLDNMPNTPGSNPNRMIRSKTMIIIWKNLGNGQFKNITESMFDVGDNINVKPNGESYQKIRMFDIDGDGQNELVYENLNTTSLYFKLIDNKFKRYYNESGFIFNSQNYPTIATIK
jgi:hypothetical protein